MQVSVSDVIERIQTARTEAFGWVPGNDFMMGIVFFFEDFSLLAFAGGRSVAICKKFKGKGEWFEVEAVAN